MAAAIFTNIGCNEFEFFCRLTGRLCMKTTQVQGITIPQGTMVQPDVWSMHYDPDYWGPEDPKKFNPER